MLIMDYLLIYMKNFYLINIMILIINNSNKEIIKTTWNLKVLYVINALLDDDKATLVNTNDEMNIFIEKNIHCIKGVILTGSEMRICKKQMLDKILDNILPIIELNVPILGICFGMQLLGLIYQSKIGSFKSLFKGYTLTKVDTNVDIFKNMNHTVNVFVEHNDWLKTKPLFFNIISKSESDIIYGIKHINKNVYGLQFHPEFSYNGIQIYKNFLKICGLKSKKLKYDEIKEVKY